MPNLLQHAFEILCNCTIQKPPHAKAVLLQPFRPAAISGNSFGRQMLAAIQLDDQLRIEADELDDVGSDGLLAAKFEAEKAPVAQCKPKLVFNRRLIATKSSGEMVLHEPLTRRAKCAPPSPTRGEGRLAQENRLHYTLKLIGVGSTTRSPCDESIRADERCAGRADTETGFDLAIGIGKSAGADGVRV